MTIVRVKGFQIFNDRQGRTRCYHRKSRTAIDLTLYPLGSAEFLAECSRLSASATSVAPRPGTLGLLIEHYRASPAFLDDLAPQTRADYQKIFDYLKPIADTALNRFDKPLVVRIRDKARVSRKRRFANYVKAVFSIIFGWGAERGYLKENPATGIKDIRRKKGAPDANRPWSDAEREAVLRALPAHMRPALALMMFSAMGPKDALKLPRTFYSAGTIATRRSKTGEPVFVPAVDLLADILDAAPKHDAITLCANSAGKPWTPSGFRASWRKVRLRLEASGEVQPGLTMYGLRHTVAVILRECGMDERTIADMLGQKTEAMARHYAKGADLRRKNTATVKSFEEELHKRGTKVVKPIR